MIARLPTPIAFVRPGARDEQGGSTSKLIGSGPQPLLYVNNPPPTPNVLTEERANAELQQLDEHLFIRWIPTAYWNERHRRFEGRYGLMCWWLQADKRREWVRQGTHPPEEACDLLGWFCSDMHVAASVPTSPDEMLVRIKELLGSMDNAREPSKVRMMQAAAKNAERRKKQKQEMVDEVVDEANTQYYHSTRATRVFQTR